MVLVLVSLTVAGGLNVSPGVDPNWKVSVEAAPVGTTVTFLPGVYHGCNVAVPPGSHPKPESRMSVLLPPASGIHPEWVCRGNFCLTQDMIETSVGIPVGRRDPGCHIHGSIRHGD